MLGPRLRGRKDTVPMALTHPATISPARPANSAAPGALAASAAIICLNEAACIGKCLQSLSGFAEIIVVDSGSTDGTLAIVDEFARRGFPIRLISQPWLGYARQKQLALDQAREPWVFSIDADEWLDDDLRASLPRLMAAGDGVSGWKVRRSLTLYGQSEPVSRWTRPEHILRLVRRGRARFDPALIVHEGLVADEGETPIARHGLLRHERSLPLNEQMKKEIVYARLKAEQRLKKGRKPSRLKLLFSPPIYFLRIFFWNRFFLCGWAGFIHAATGADVFAHDRSDPPPVVLRSNGAMRRYAVGVSVGGGGIGRGGMGGEVDDEALDELEVIIPNLNWRYSGGTAVNRTIAPLIAKRWRAAWLGPDRPDGIAGLTMRDLLRLRFRPPSHGKVRIWHARRNVEMIAGLVSQPARLRLCADLQFGLPAPENLAHQLSDRPDGRPDRDQRGGGAISQAPSDRHSSRHRRRSLFPARRPARRLRRDRPAGTIWRRNLRPGEAAEGQRPVRRGDVPALA